jgi:ATP-dependent Lon protease
MSAPNTETEFISIMGARTEGDAPAPKISPRALPEVLPVLGLSDIVIFPGMVAPLLVESAESMKLIDDVVGGDRLVGMVLQRKPDAEKPKPDEMHEFGTAARVLKMIKFPDNTVRVLVEGLWRIRITGYDSTDPYLRARFERQRDVLDDSVELTALARSTHSQFEEVIRLSPGMAEQVKTAVMHAERPGHLADLIAANLNLELPERQALIANPDVKERLKALLPLLNRELELLNLSSKIQSDVANSISKTQRDFFLREQLRAIQRELGETEHVNPELKNLREQITKAELPDDIRKVANHELERLSQMPPAMAEYGVTRHYLDWILALPWTKETEDKIDLAAAQKILDAQHFGLTKVKDRLVEFLAVIKLRKKLKGPILCLVGPPGVGKTSLGKSVADALGRKFARI